MRKWKLGRIVTLIAVAIAIAELVLSAITHVREGEGAAVYQTYWGMWVHWTSVPIFFGALALAAVVALIWRWVERWRDMH